MYSTRTGHLPEALTCIRPEVYSSPNFVRNNRHLWIQGVGKGNTREKRVGQGWTRVGKGKRREGERHFPVEGGQG